MGMEVKVTRVPLVISEATMLMDECGNLSEVGREPGFVMI